MTPLHTVNGGACVCLQKLNGNMQQGEGTRKKKYPWGDTPATEAGEGRLKKWKMNVWQGDFPIKNTKEDGYLSTAPVNSYEPNNYGLYNTIGNVWEWTATKDIIQQGNYILRGGSYLDSIDGSYNHPATMSTRMSNSPDSASSNTGVRCAMDIKGDGTEKDKKKKKRKGYHYVETEEQKRAKRREKLKNLDQDMLSKIAEEGGIEALQEFLGDAATVATPEMLKKKQQELKEMKENYAREEL